MPWSFFGIADRCNVTRQIKILNPGLTENSSRKFSFRCYDIDDLNWDMMNIDGGGEGVNGDHFRLALLIAVVRLVSFPFHTVRNVHIPSNLKINWLITCTHVAHLIWILYLDWSLGTGGCVDTSVATKFWPVLQRL